MPGIDPNVACHRLNIDEKFHAVYQKIRNVEQSKKDEVALEVEKLLEAGFIRPAQYPRGCPMSFWFQRRMRILERADDSSRLATWSNFLGAYEIKYETITIEKGHALAALLADFLVDDIETVTEEEDELLNKPIDPTTNHTGGESAMEFDTPETLWTVFSDGSSNVSGAGVGCVILTPEGSRIKKATRLGFRASNNEAEYEASIIDLMHADIQLLRDSYTANL
ncbi:uncharacterized protein LOC113271809 [Papaver somniferum]|uniref:uncharacterized protein LOC113271809 n=1 Tax=Papaver somniferum TaxID=3469 RepID=UPI000E6FE26F|nr:uncharacterized protein LOC113271809 [Papaver somniferum]